MNLALLIVSVLLIILGVLGIVAWFKSENSWIAAIGLVLSPLFLISGCYLLFASLVGFDGLSYQYTTFSGEKGESRYCHEQKGGLICLKNGGAINVESFKRKISGEKE